MYDTLTAMIKIPLPGDFITYIDDADELLVAGFPWRVLKTHAGLYYVQAWNGYQHFYMHRLITGVAPRKEVDHWNGNGLDNRRNNLRIVSHLYNQGNQRARTNQTSRYKGVYWDKNRDRWMVQFTFNGKTRSIGRFTDELEAAQAYDAAATEALGRFARLNLPDEPHGPPLPDTLC